MEGKFCFTYCGDDRCDCGLADPFAIPPNSQADGDTRLKGNPMNTPNPDLSAALASMKIACALPFPNKQLIWGGDTPLGNFGNLRALVDAVEGREPTDADIISEENADNVRLLDWLAKRMGLPHDEEVSQFNICAWLDRIAPSPTPAAIPEGWVLAPVEPDDTMVNAPDVDCGPRTAAKTYRAMIAARPAPPAPALSAYEAGFIAGFKAAPEIMGASGLELSADAHPEAKGPVVDDRYPYVYHDRATWARASVSLSQGDDYIRVDMLLENKPGGRWTVVEMTADEAEQMGLRLLERVKTLRAALAAALGNGEG